MTTSYTKLPLIVADGRKICHMVIKYTNIFHSNALQIGIFGLKINHLATLVKSKNEKYFIRLTSALMNN
jgi:hypothetical protein